MSKVFVESEKLVTYAHDLSSFKNVVEDVMNALNSNLNNLGESWRDQEFEKFREHFEKTRQSIIRFSAEVEQTVPKILRDAEAAADIHREGLPS